ncbi:hypothetical protein [Providencia hangzhouensis]|uniref:hypothetical protein n=1 Tax=Providencia hangzhouensis TaxID=3031799 RepID=UPI0034DD7D19
MIIWPLTFLATAISVATIVLTSVVTSFIDANFADAVNKELISLANEILEERRENLFHLFLIYILQVKI